MVPVVLAVAVYMALDHPSVVMRAAVPPPDTAQRFTKTEPLYEAAPLPKAPAVLPSKTAVTTQRALGAGIFKCEESNGHVTYSEYPCDGKLIDTKPTSGGFGDNWSISVKH